MATRHRLTLCLLCVALLAPAAPAARGASVPLIVDTDLFSDADDVGALATAFGLQLRGEAQVVAVAVNKRASRAAVAANSWKCVAAVTSFYNSGEVPIGSAMPDDGSSAGDGGFAGPCADKGPPAPPAPDPAVAVYRRALAAQPDGSVVIASAGFFGNLSALLNSAPDAISPLTGRELVARKVARLVAMAGGYPSRGGETNLGGDPRSAQNVAGHWPTKIVWSGFEVGDGVLTGQSLSSVHPTGSPVRRAYEAFVGPDTSISSWDLTAVYHAARPDDPLLREVGPGTNVVHDDGSNTFTKGPGDQFYLELTDEPGLEDAIEELLDTLHPTPAPTPEPEPAPAPAPQASGPPPPDPAPASEPAPPEPVVTPTARPVPGCVVPTLRGRTLDGARRLLRRHRCALGRVSLPRHRRRLRVVRQSPAPRTVRRSGGRVDITLRA